MDPRRGGRLEPYPPTTGDHQRHETGAGRPPSFGRRKQPRVLRRGEDGRDEQLESVARLSWDGVQSTVLLNNISEGALRVPVVGRKNHYGSQKERGTRVASVLYSLLQSAVAAGVDPSAYLETATRRALHSPGAVLLPHQYAAELVSGSK